MDNHQINIAIRPRFPTSNGPEDKYLRHSTIRRNHAGSPLGVGHGRRQRLRCAHLFTKPESNLSSYAQQLPNFLVLSFITVNIRRMRP